MPQHDERVASIFSRKGAYARFKDFLDSEGALDKWRAYEEEATERALREWCEDNDIELIHAEGNKQAG
jgi:hypothetical protein